MTPRSFKRKAKVAPAAGLADVIHGKARQRRSRQRPISYIASGSFRQSGGCFAAMRLRSPAFALAWESLGSVSRSSSTAPAALFHGHSVFERQRALRSC